MIEILFLTAFNESFVEYLLGSSKYKKYLALLFGVLFSVLLEISIPELIGLSFNFEILEWIISGIIIGRGSNYLHDIVSKK